MNQDQIKSNLMQLMDTGRDFSVLLTGKKSSRVDGLYKPDTAEILIHNRNHGDDDSLMYTAIHEYAHHVQFTGPERPTTSRVHSGTFWEIFYGLLDRAEERGMCRNVCTKDPRFIELAREIKDRILSANGSLMLEFGRLLVRAHELCSETRVSFEDFIDRCIGVHRKEARQAMKVYAMGIDPSLGYDSMKVVAAIKGEDRRADAQEDLMRGERVETVKMKYAERPAPGDRLDSLMEEKTRTEHSIQRLLDKLERLEKMIREMQSER
jgi:hypothetical protein